MTEVLITHRGFVYPKDCDHMDHLNVAGYVEKFVQATWDLFAEVGMYRRSLNENNLGVIGEVAAIIDLLAVCTDTKIGKPRPFTKEGMAKAAEHPLVAEIDDE